MASASSGVMAGQPKASGIPSRWRGFPFAEVREALEKLSEVDDTQEEQDDHPDLCVGVATDPEAFNRWCEANKGILANLIDGRIIAKELPFKAHARGCSRISRQFVAQLGAFLEYSENTAAIARISGSVYTPDILLEVEGMSHLVGGNANHEPGYPVIVVEVACSQRPLDLHSNASIFLSAEFPSVEYYIGFKRYDFRLDGSQCLLATVYDRMNPHPLQQNQQQQQPIVFQPTDIVSFGTCGLHFNAFWSGNPLVRGVGAGGPACNAHGQYVLTFPAARIYRTLVGGVPAGVAANLTLDLFEVKRGLSVLNTAS